MTFLTLLPTLDQLIILKHKTPQPHNFSLKHEPPQLHNFISKGEAPKNLSGRLVAATWWLFGFIIIASYTANLAAFLTVSRLETPVESLEDLSKQYKIQYSPLNGSSTMVYFERMAYIEEKFYQIWKDMSLNDSTDEYERSKLAVWDYPVRYFKPRPIGFLPAF